MRVLVACEFSGTVRDAFRALGHDAFSCDLLPTEKPGPHYQGDVRDVLRDGWDLMVAHPPCTYLSRAGARWWAVPARRQKAGAAHAFVRELYDAPIPHVAIENPIGLLNKFWRYPDQTIQPWEFGDPYTKATCLWLKNLPPLLASCLVEKTEAWMKSNTGHGRRKGQRSQPGIAKNAKDAARTFPGIAAAMAAQWGAVHPPVPFEDLPCGCVAIGRERRLDCRCQAHKLSPEVSSNARTLRIALDARRHLPYADRLTGDALEAADRLLDSLSSARAAKGGE